VAAQGVTRIGEGHMRKVTASVSVTEVLVIVVVFGVTLGIAGITVAKGHVALFIAGLLLLGLVWLIAAPRLAKPNSPWAKRFYGSEKLERSRARYPDIEPAVPSKAGLAAAIGFGVIGAAFVAGLVDGLT
jgi:hypothetical protein